VCTGVPELYVLWNNFIPVHEKGSIVELHLPIIGVLWAQIQLINFNNGKKLSLHELKKLRLNCDEKSTQLLCASVPELHNMGGLTNFHALMQARPPIYQGYSIKSRWSKPIKLDHAS
jgi:hypothetical protein